jgi:hypothetical protein
MRLLLRAAKLARLPSSEQGQLRAHVCVFGTITQCVNWLCCTLFLQAKDLMNAMLTSRKEADELAKQYDIPPQPAAGSGAAAAAAAAGDGEAGGAAAAGGADEGPGQIPDVVIMKMLAREALLTVRA